MVDAKKIKLDAVATWTLLKGASSIAIAKGKKIQTFTSTNAEKEAILKNAMGPSGNLRAPTYRVKDQFIIGFNTELYEDWVK